MPDDSNLGSLLGNDQIIFRAFAEKGFRERPKKVRPGAYLLREIDVNDGLSVGLSPDAAVKYLSRNEGYCSIQTGAVHTLPYGLQVRVDVNDPMHAFICNLPYLKMSDEDREKAMLIAGILARLSKVETCDPYTPRASATPK
jgi:hypothetical protein